MPRRRLADFKIVDDRFQSVGRDFEARKRDRQFEAPASGTAGIQVEQAVYGVDLRHVGVAGNNDIDALSYGIDLQGVEVVQNVEQPSGEPHELGFGKFGGPLARIRVSSDRRDGGNSPQRGDDLGIADVAAVNDMVDMGQHAKSLRPEQTVRIRDDADGESHRSVRLKHSIARRAAAS